MEIHIGNIFGGNQNIGSHNTVIASGQSGGSQVIEAVAALPQLIRANANKVSDASALEEAAIDLAAELRSNRPRAERLLELLQILAAGAKGVSAIVGVVDGILAFVSRDDDVDVVVLTALPEEYRAVRAHLTDLRQRPHPSGTIFEIGVVPGRRIRVAMAETDKGNTRAGVLAERAIATFKPAALLFVGIAGARHDDLKIGDVVVATRVYNYHGGRSDPDGFRARPHGWDAPHRLEQIARHLAHDPELVGLLGVGGESVTTRLPQTDRRR